MPLARPLFALILLVLINGTLLAQPTRPPLNDEEKTAWLAGDLRAISRSAELATDLRQVRQVLLAMIDQQVTWLREQRADGTYRWASLQREEGGRKTEEKVVERVWTEEQLQELAISAPSAYRVVISVPQKRGVFSSNSRVFVRNVIIDSVATDGKSVRVDLPVKVWVEPGDVHGLPLPEIASNARATAYLGVESGGKKAIAELAVLEASLLDDPLNPYYPAVRRLLDLRTIVSRDDIRRGELKTAADEALLALPGELEKRVAAQQETIQRRETIALGGELLGSIEIGDATPDVVAKLQEISRMLEGSLAEQGTARAELTDLIRKLRPEMIATEP